METLYITYVKFLGSLVVLLVVLGIGHGIILYLNFHAERKRRRKKQKEYLRISREKNEEIDWIIHEILNK